MKALILQFLILGLATAAFAQDLPSFSITTNQEADVKQKLEAYENGKLTLDELTLNGGAELAQQLIAYYLSHTNDVTVKMKLPISRCFAGFDRYQEAARLAADYVQIYSNEWRGWKILGVANLKMLNYSEAVEALTNSARLGDDGSYTPLAFAALQTDNLNVVRNIIPHLLALKNSKQTSPYDQLSAVGLLVIYSLKADEQSVFVKALGGVSAKQIMSRTDLTQLINEGCERFKGADIDKIRQEMESATSSTNTVSSPTH
jgi:hypothetical protein